jgi:hypothetical protein
MWSMTTRTIAVVAVFVYGVAAPARGQTVSDILKLLVTNEGVATGSVERDRAAAQATSDTISRALQASLATLPVTTSSGGFVYRLNPDLGTVERASQSFGPSFVERALTAGRSHSSFGLSIQHLRLDALDGHNLRDGTLITTANKFTDQPEPFDVDLLTLSIDANIATLYGNVGVGDRVELGFAAPLVSLRLDGTRVNLYRGRTFTQAGASVTSVGLADVVMRSKITVYANGGKGVAGAVDVRVPTGSEKNLLGTGSTSVKVSAFGSMEGNPMSTHVNVGVTLGGLARELSYGGAAAVAAGQRVTLTGEVLGRWIDVPSGMVPIVAPHPTLAGVETIRLLPGSDHLNSVTFVPGVKWNATDTWVVVANVTVPLTSGGLTSRLTPFVGLDYAFSW